MKKKIFLGLLFLLSGYMIGKICYLKYQNYYINQKEKYYFLQEGIYSNNEFLEHTNTIDLKTILIEYRNNQIVVYCAITRDMDVVDRIIKLYENKGIELELIEKNLHNEEFKNNVEQFDLLIKTAQSEEEILKIEEVVIANYEELIKKYNE